MHRSCLALGWAILLTASGAGTVMAQESEPPGAHPGDGVPDPAGRIAFGRITRHDDLFGQVVALYAIDPDGSDLVQLTDGESAFPAWSPDGSRLAFTTGLPDGSWQIATMAPDGSDVRILTSGPGIHEVPSWSPDGTWIAYDYSPTLPDDPDFHTVLYRMDADGSNQGLLGNADTFDIEPRISPDGTKVAFGRLTSEGDDWRSVLVVRDVASGEESTLEGSGHAIEHPNWSPDGEWIIYDIAPWITGDLADERLERVAADGTGEPVVVWEPSGTDAAFEPWYSPDGSRIVFGCTGPAGDDSACLLDAGGSGLEILVDEPGVHENHFSWGVGPTPQATVEARDVAFSPADLTITSAGATPIVLINKGRVTHNLTIDELAVQVVVPAGATAATILEDPEAGTYQFYCSVSGHRQAGMVGTLTVG